ncbi:uncharacterized protein Z518_08132 [Rhinocladiella mackenziei CBS 650.93]|uniref:Histone deacetylase complex subunit SAP30 Sin3 binding domain-containing protein n=1 Tax=Rhinocladiella mackenziei CBS 650.93 TaxID=1442369 RepID=A0A0D2GV82_9EURO|nr:uncharacterized protein Z518_08132 [Rhinocladiella mackenziei CBS 650.93]KIX02193.1 hypothetical protein Z518_08132 [Rhinocladiella mackenziei CBS 650.93]
MPPARSRNIDDSRSETSSTITNQKEKSLFGPASGSGVSKGRRVVSSALNGSSAGNKTSTNGAAAPSASAVTDGDQDLNLPQTDWATMPTSILRTYRIAHRLPVPSAFNHPHAQITYMSSQTALRAPSAVHARRKLRDQKYQRRKQQELMTGISKGGKSQEKSKDTNTGKQSNTAPSIAQSIELPDHSTNQGHPPSSPSTASTTYLGPREPASNLATAVRKHFNARQLSEVDTIARFIYVVQQNGRAVRTEGSGGDGTGYWMGSHGRAVRKIDGPGGEVGFRLRFHP